MESGTEILCSVTAGTDSEQAQGVSPGVLSPAPPFGEQPDPAAPAAEPSAAAAAIVQTPADEVAMNPLAAQSAGLIGVGAPAPDAAAGGPAVAAGVAELGGLDAAAAVQMLTVSAQATAPPVVSTPFSASYG